MDGSYQNTFYESVNKWRSWLSKKSVLIFIVIFPILLLAGYFTYDDYRAKSGAEKIRQEIIAIGSPITKATVSFGTSTEFHRDLHIYVELSVNDVPADLLKRIVNAINKHSNFDYSYADFFFISPSKDIMDQEAVRAGNEIGLSPVSQQSTRLFVTHNALSRCCQ